MMDDWEDDMQLDCDEMLDDSMLDTTPPAMAPSEAAVRVSRVCRTHRQQHDEGSDSNGDDAAAAAVCI